MPETLYQTADTVITLLDSYCRGNLLARGCKSICIIQRMQASLYQTAGAGVYQTVDAGLILSGV